MLRDTAPGTTLRIVKRGEVVWERQGGAKPPSLSGVRATLEKNGDLELAWKLDAKVAAKDTATDTTEVWVRWTNDDGKTWHALTVGQRGNSATIPAEQLPTGSVRFELLAHDGFHTASATTEVLALPARPPAVAILYPSTSARVYGDRLIHLWGSASSFAGAALDAEAAEWSIDGKGVGKGLDVWVENPGAGRHNVLLRVTEGSLVGEATQAFEVIGESAPSVLG